MPNLKAVRDRMAHYLTPDVAAAADMSLQQLQQIFAGAFKPTPEQIEHLARRVGVKQ